MRKSTAPVLVQGSSLDEDALRLPREPGMIRRFWARHPLFADILIAVIALLLSLPTIIVRAPLPQPPSAWMIGLPIALLLGGCLALLWRRRWPLWVFGVGALPVLIFDPSLTVTLNGPAAVIALYSIAVYRSVRACWTAFGVACGVIALHTIVLILMQPASASTQLNVDISTAVGLLLGALVGVNVGNRRRYTLALIERSRQLLTERDQEAALAAAAERTRIAREMHDIVSHSLTVIVALSEGATATADPDQARDATRAVATTAREALTEMRVMLGVLRSDETETAPREPLLDGSLVGIVQAARASGYPVTLTVSGVPPTSTAHRLAVLRVVQEGITNAMRYSDDPTYIRCTTHYSQTQVSIEVENDAARSSSRSPREGSLDSVSVGSGWGLRGLRERVDLLGGSLTAGPAGPGVWRLSAEIPVGAG